jgi:hypothetical protein
MEILRWRKANLSKNGWCSAGGRINRETDHIREDSTTTMRASAPFNSMTWCWSPVTRPAGPIETGLVRR